MPILGGCLLSTNTPAPEAAPSPPVTDLPHELPRECQKLAKRVPDPGAKKDEDMGDIAARYKAAYLKSSHRLDAVAQCENHQADAVAKGAP